MRYAGESLSAAVATSAVAGFLGDAARSSLGPAIALVSRADAFVGKYYYPEGSIEHRHTVDFALVTLCVCFWTAGERGEPLLAGPRTNAPPSPPPDPLVSPPVVAVSRSSSNVDVS